MNDVVVKNISQTKIDIQVENTSTFSLAAQQNAYPVLKSIRISFPKDDEQELTSFNSLTVKLKAIDGWVEEEIWYIDRLEPGQSISLKIKELRFPFEKLFGITEEVSHDLSFIVLDEGQKILAGYLIEFL